MNLNMPSVPKADLIAVAQAAVAVAVAFGAPLNADQQKSLLALATIIAAILVTADVKRRGNRLMHAHKFLPDEVVTEETTVTYPPPKPVPSAFKGNVSATTGGVTVKDVTFNPAGGSGIHIPPAAKKPAAKKKAPPKKKP